MDSDNQDISVPRTSPFESVRRVADDGSEYWSARDLAKIPGYAQYNKFTRVIAKAEEACENSTQAVSDHFTHVGEMIETGKGAKREFDTVYLSRYACYLIVQNADPSKPIVALGQTYFAVHTRCQELRSFTRATVNTLTLAQVGLLSSTGSLACPSERSEESAHGPLRFFAALRMTGERIGRCKEPTCLSRRGRPYHTRVSWAIS